MIRESEANVDFLRRFLPKLDWTALVDTARSVSAVQTSLRRLRGRLRSVIWQGAAEGEGVLMHLWKGRTWSLHAKQVLGLGTA